MSAIRKLRSAIVFCGITSFVFCTTDPAGPDNNDGCPVVKNVGQSVSGTVTWHPDTVYIITDNDFWIGDNSTLTILPGTVVKVKEGYKIRVSGSGAKCIAEGTPDSMIVFTSANDNQHGCITNAGAVPDSGDWLYVSAGNQCRFSYCKFMYGGGSAPVWPGVLRTDDSAAYVTNCVFAHNASIALDAKYTLRNATIKNNLFYGNEIPLQISGGITLYDSDGNRFDTTINNQEISNTKNAVFVDTYAGSGDPLAKWEGTNIQWGITTVPYVVQNDVSVGEKNILQVMDDVVVKLMSGVRISFYYTTTNLYVSKSAVFTSFKDDTRGGDTGGDGTATTPADGDWDGIKGSEATPTNTPWVENSIIFYDSDHTGSSRQYDFPIPKL